MRRLLRALSGVPYVVRLHASVSALGHDDSKPEISTGHQKLICWDCFGVATEALADRSLDSAGNPESQQAWQTLTALTNIPSR